MVFIVLLYAAFFKWSVKAVLLIRNFTAQTFVHTNAHVQNKFRMILCVFGVGELSV